MVWALNLSCKSTNNKLTLFASGYLSLLTDKSCILCWKEKFFHSILSTIHIISKFLDHKQEKLIEKQLEEKEINLFLTQMPSYPNSWGILLRYIINSKLQIRADWINEFLEEFYDCLHKQLWHIWWSGLNQKWELKSCPLH